MRIVWEFDLRRYLTLLVYQIHIDEDYQMVRVEGGLYGHVRGLKYELIKIRHMD